MRSLNPKAERCPLVDSPHAYTPDYTRIRPMWFRSTAMVYYRYSDLRTCLRDARFRDWLMGRRGVPTFLSSVLTLARTTCGICGLISYDGRDSSEYHDRLLEYDEYHERVSGYWVKPDVYTALLGWPQTVPGFASWVKYTM